MGFRNVLELDVEKTEGKIVTVAGRGLRLRGTVKQPLTGKRVYVAIRPDEISPGTDTANAIDGRVENVEYCGRDSLLDVLSTGGVKLHARGPARVQHGDAIKLVVPPERVLVYPHEASK